MEAIKVRNLTKEYGKTRGVEDLTFDVFQGEVLGLLGPNGAGKTTTMRIITGYMPPTSGQVTVAGYDVFYEPMEVKRRIGYLPENPPLYLDMTVASFLRYVAELKDIPRREIPKQVEKAVERTGLEPVYGRLIANISRGYRQRVGIAQALLGDPPVLVLDEPTIGLDPKQIIEIRELIAELGRHHTVILSSHILPEVQALCGRVVIINEGRLMAVDSPQELARRLRGSQRLLLRIKGTLEQAEKAFGALPSVLSVSRPQPDGAGDSRPGQSQDREDGTLVYVESQAEGDVREEIFWAAASVKLPILEMRQEDMSLEEVFLRLTTEETGVSEDA